MIIAFATPTTTTTQGFGFGSTSPSNQFGKPSNTLGFGNSVATAPLGAFGGQSNFQKSPTSLNFGTSSGGLNLGGQSTVPTFGGFGSTSTTTGSNFQSQVTTIFKIVVYFKKS
jgi:hypothetical protein